MIVLSKLTYQTYRFLFDIKYFAKQIKDAGYEEDDIDLVIKNANSLYKSFLKVKNEDNEKKSKKIIEKAHLKAQEILEQLKYLKCKEDKFISEKVDLIVESFSIKEKTEVLLSKTNLV